MPGVWETDQFTSGGLKSIVEFTGRLREAVEDVEGQFGLQVALHFYDVEITETQGGETVMLENDEYTDWFKQSNKKGSVNEALVARWNEFAKAHFGSGCGVRFSAFNDKLVTYRRIEVIAAGTNAKGEALSPGYGIVPVAIVEEGAPRGQKPKAQAQEPEAGGEVSDALVEKALELVGDEGTTRAVLLRELNKAAATKKALAEAGGINGLLAFLREAGLLAVQGQAISPVGDGEPTDSEAEGGDDPF